MVVASNYLSSQNFITDAKNFSWHNSLQHYLVNCNIWLHFLRALAGRGGAAAPVPVCRRCMRVRGGEHVATCQHFYSGVKAVHTRLFLVSRASTPRIPPIRHNDERGRKRKENDARGEILCCPSSRHRQWWPVRPRGESDQGRARASRSEPPEPSISSAHAVVMGRRHHVLCAAAR
jgi:hypothetical protein